MTWFRVDDALTRSRKVLSIPRAQRLAAMGLWVLAGSWSAGEALDGVIPAYMVEELGGTAEAADALVLAGLWSREDDSFRFHDWTDYNPDAGTVRAARAVMSEEGQHGNHLRWHVKRNLWVDGCKWCGSGIDRVPDGDPDRSPESGPNPPDPSRPDKETSSEVASATPRPDVEKLLDLLDAELTRNGVTKLPARSKANTDAARLLLDRDGRTVDQVERAIRFAQGDPFWRSNVLSMAKLREKYEQLQLAAQRPAPGALTPPRRDVAKNDEWMYR